jgi:hypothetical protein
VLLPQYRGTSAQVSGSAGEVAQATSIHFARRVLSNSSDILDRAPEGLS